MALEGLAGAIAGECRIDGGNIENGVVVDKGFHQRVGGLDGDQCCQPESGGHGCLLDGQVARVQSQQTDAAGHANAEHTEHGKQIDLAARQHVLQPVADGEGQRHHDRVGGAQEFITA